MIDKKILQDNLNDQVSYADFFGAFGYTGKDRIFLRGFDDRKETAGAKNMDQLCAAFDSITPHLRQLNAQNWGIFFVVNGDGQTDREVKHARAQFIDFDDFTFEDQIDKLNEFPLEPSVIIKAKKSLHCYWLLQDGAVKYFREVQERLNQYFGSDPIIKNESRVMRLYGFEHRKADPVMVTLIKFDPDLRYTQRQLHECLPVLESKPARKDRTPRADSGELIPVGQRHHYVVSRIGEFLDRLGNSADDDSILALVRADFLSHCEDANSVIMEDFDRKYLQTIKKLRKDHDDEENDPDFYKYAMKAWREENPGKTFDPEVDSWDEVRKAGERAKAEGKTFEISVSKKSDLDLELTEKLKVKGSFQNYCLIAEGDSYLQDKIYYNALDGRVMLRGVSWDCGDHPMRDVDLAHIRKYISGRYGIDDEKKIKRAIELAADKHKIHPILDMLNALEWDGKLWHLAELYPRYLGAERSDYTTAATTLQFIGACMRVIQPGCKFDYCNVLSDTKQGTGKSTMVRLSALNDLFFCDSIGDLGDLKKAYEAIRGHWIIELCEMISTRKTQYVESIKAFITRTDDDYRDPYGIYPERRPRQCIFVGTTNKPQFLPEDKTGNRRFIPILCDGSRAVKHPLDDEAETREFIKQCYAEAMALIRSGQYSLTLDHCFDDELNELREMSTPEDSKVGVIQEWLDHATDPETGKPIDMVCTRMIWEKALPNDGREPSRFELSEISDIMNLKIQGWERYRGRAGEGTSGRYRFTRYGSQRSWMRKSVSNIVSNDVSMDTNSVPDDDQDDYLEVSDEDLRALGLDF